MLPGRNLGHTRGTMGGKNRGYDASLLQIPALRVSYVCARPECLGESMLGCITGGSAGAGLRMWTGSVRGCLLDRGAGKRALSCFLFALLVQVMVEREGMPGAAGHDTKASRVRALNAGWRFA